MITSAVILARGGSVGLPNKNILSFCGKPLLAWTIEACLEVCAGNVFVSSDSEQVLEVAEQYGANLINRPASISGNRSSSEIGWLHAISEISSSQKSSLPDVIIAPQVTSPLRKKNDLASALKKFEVEKLSSLFSAVDAGDICLWDNSGQQPSPMNIDFHGRKRRQDISSQIIENGSFYMFKTEQFMSEKNRFFGKVGTFLQDKWQAFEIDDAEDFEFCELIMSNYLLGQRDVC